jgi:uncharacterized protein (TIGR02246 family)
MKRKGYLLVAALALAGLVAFLAGPARSAGGNGTAAPEQGDQPKAAGEPKETNRAEDEAAVRQAAANFSKRLEQGDAKAVADSWTENGEYISSDGTTIRGRAALEAAYAKAFAKKKNPKVKITIDSIRFPSKDTAIEEGHAKTYKDDAEQPTTSRYSVLHVREGGRWLMAVLREWPDEGVSLNDLDWLIGTWEGKTEDALVRTVYKWGPKKNSIRCEITIKGEDRDESAMEVLLKDPRGDQLRSWIFDEDGSYGESTWTRDGKVWVIAATGVEADGGEVTATNILTPIDGDTFTWQSTERTEDGTELPDIAPVKIKRVK